MNILVIGGSGFIGSHLADKLSESGHKVTIYDKEVSPWLRSDQKMITGDILDRSKILEAIQGNQVVYHFAGIADIGEAGERAFSTLESNIMGTANIAEACVEAKVERLLYASTLYVYSSHGGFYRVSKQAAEDIILMYAEKSGLNYTILRYGSLYGERSQKWNGLRKYVERAMKTGKIIYGGTGEEIREYIHVRDAAKLSIRALRNEYKNTCLTLTGTQVLKVTEVIKVIEEILGRKIDIVKDSLNADYNHYVRTPYRYTPKTGLKLVPDEFIDLGQGILNLVDEIQQDLNNGEQWKK